MCWLEWVSPREATARSARRFLSRWQLSASAGGPLVVRPLFESLTAQELSWMLARLPRRLHALSVPHILFDLRNVRQLEQPWTPVFAALIEFARGADVPCRIFGLQGQPAHAASLYRHNRELAEMLKGAPLSDDPDRDLRAAG